MRFSPNAQWLVTGSADNTLRILDCSDVSDAAGELSQATEVSVDWLHLLNTPVLLGERSFLWTVLVAIVLLAIAIFLQGRL